LGGLMPGTQQRRPDDFGTKVSMKPLQNVTVWGESGVDPNSHLQEVSRTTKSYS